MFSPVSVYCFVGWFAGLHTKGLMDFHETWMEDGSLPRIRLTFFNIVIKFLILAFYSNTGLSSLILD